jgi:hypothetical protein
LTISLFSEPPIHIVTYGALQMLLLTYLLTYPVIAKY